MERPAPHAAVLAFALLLTAARPGPLCAAELPGIAVPQPEAPRTVFSLGAGGPGVDLSLLGSWTASVSFGAGLLFLPGLPARALDSFPGMETGFVFTQVPDLSASLLLLERWFLEASVLGSFDRNSLRMGYRGQPGEPVQSVVVGTQGQDLAPSPLLQVPAQPAAGSLGASARLLFGAGTNDLVLRWDATARRTKVFLGKNELVEEDLRPQDYARGRWFFLPDTAVDAQGFEVLLEDPSGTLTGSDAGRRYRRAGYDDVILDSSRGLVSLRAASKGRVLVHYTTGAGANVVGDPAIGRAGLPAASGLLRNPSGTTDFDWGVVSCYLGQVLSARRVTVPGVGTCLLLWEPGDNSPFEIDNSYRFTTSPPSDPSRISYQLVALDPSAAVPSGLLFTSIPAEQRFTVAPGGATRFEAFYPLPDPDGLLYGPQRDALDGAEGWVIRARFLSPVDAFVLEPDLVPGSVQVSVNGVPEPRFTVDAASGTLTLGVTLGPADRVEARWEKAEQGLRGGDVVLGWRDTLPLSEAATAWFSAGIRWNANPWTYSQEPYAKSGTVIGTAGVSVKTGAVSASAEAAVAFTNPDTTGILRLFGMETTRVSPPLTDDDAYPSGVPPSLSAAARGLLYYRDYRQYDLLGNATLLGLGASPRPDRVPYADGKRAGPYSVAAAGGSLGASNLAFEYVLGSGGWVGAQVPLSAGSDVDLSGARTLTIRLKGTGLSGAIEVRLDAGSISEDLDGNGVLDAEGSPAQPGFPFRDTAHAVTLKVGAGPRLEGNGRPDSEDRNGNGILDLEDPARVVTWTSADDPALAASGDFDWITVTIPLTDADRSRLVAARGVRIAIVDAGSGSSGTILLDGISFDSAPFWPAVTAADRPKVTVRQVPEPLALSPPATGKDFASAWPSTAKLFHPQGEQNQVLEVAWNGPALPFTVKGFSALGTGGIGYDTVVVYVRSAQSTQFDFALLDARGRGAAWSVTTGDGAWHEVRVSRKAGTITVDGAAAGAPSRFDPVHGSLGLLTVTVTGPAAGTAWFDEVWCTDPQVTAGAALVGTVSLSLPGALLSAGPVLLLSDASVNESISLASAGFAPLYGVPNAAEDLSSRTDVAATLLYARVEATLLARRAGGETDLSGGHRVTFPAASSPVSVMDAFSLAAGGAFSREDRLVLGVPGFGQLTLDAAAGSSPLEGASGTLDQSWRADASLAGFGPVSLVGSLALAQALGGYALDESWYGARWAREAALLLPWEAGSDLRRTESAALAATITLGSFTLDARADAGAAAGGWAGGTFVQDSSAGLSLAVTARLGPGEGEDPTLSVTYSRRVEVSTTPAAGERFAAEAAELSRVLALQGFMLGSVPIAEIFSDNGPSVLPAWSGAASGSYQPALSLALQRSYGSRLADLFVPSLLELKLGQSLEREGDLAKALVSVWPRTVTRAVNLFGELGTHPLLPGIRTDEYSLGLAARVDGPPAGPAALASLTADGYATLTGISGSEVSVAGTLGWDGTGAGSFSGTIQAWYDWTMRPADGIEVPFLPRALTAAAWLEHRETADLASSWSAAGSFHPATVTLGHATSLVFGDRGSVRAGVSLGFDAEDMGAGAMAFRIAFRATLEGKLTF